MEDDLRAADEEASAAGPATTGEPAAASRSRVIDSRSVLEPEPEPEQEPEPEEPRRPADPLRSLIRLGWAMIVVLILLAAFLISGTVRITNAINKVACVQRAQTDYIATAGPGSKANDVNLARLGIKTDLAKCGH